MNIYRSLPCAIGLVLSFSYVSAAADNPRKLDCEDRAKNLTGNIRLYVEKKYGWEKGAYDIDLVKCEENHVMIFVISNKYDKKAKYPGGGRSFEIDVDENNSESIREYHYE